MLVRRSERLTFVMPFRRGKKEEGEGEKKEEEKGGKKKEGDGKSGKMIKAAAL